MEIRLASEIISDSIVDGVGLRTVIFVQGCTHRCKGCHNPSTHDLDGGFLSDTKDIMERINGLRLQKGITLSGGEPFLQARACAEIARHAKSIGLDVWCYTGYTMEEIMESENLEWLEFLSVIDVLVDGRFILEDRDLTLPFRGSKNQRIFYL